MRIICPHCQNVNNIPKKDSYKKANCGSCKKSLLENKIVELDINNFDEVIVNSDTAVIVDFWAPWCGPCKSMEPTFKKVALDFPLKVLFTKVNTENEQELGSRANIRSIPTLVVYVEGKEVERVSGALDENTLKSLASKYS
jgi:thioredoxin 2